MKFRPIVEPPNTIWDDSSFAFFLRGRCAVWFNGELVQETENQIVTGAHPLVAMRFAEASTGQAVTHCAIGTDGTAPAVANTALGAEAAGLTREAITLARTDETVTGSVTFAAGNPTQADQTIREAGLFTAAAAGTMYNRILINPVRIKGANDALRLDWTLTF